MQFCIKGALMMPAGYPGLLLCIPFAGFLGSSCLLKWLLPEVFFSYIFHIPIIWVLKNKSVFLGVKIRFWNKCMLNLNWIDSEKYYLGLYYFQTHCVTKGNTDGCSSSRFILRGFFLTVKYAFIFSFDWLIGPWFYHQQPFAQWPEMAPVCASVTTA